MNIYDFDETIYNSDSTKKFYLYAIKKRKKVLIFLPLQALGFALYKLHLIRKTRFKEYFYLFLRAFFKDEIDNLIASFWQEEKKNIKAWYLEVKNESDIIISASPEFLLEPILKELGVKYLIASKVDKNTGKYDGLNCFGEEKVNRLVATFGEEVLKEIDNFYSDSYSDTPLAKLSKNAFIVQGSSILQWDFNIIPKKNRE